jgi:tetratricopeptide (TPR) repeat protein
MLLAPQLGRADNAADCVQTKNLDLRIKACTAFINIVRQKDQLSFALNNRATALWDKGDKERALQDFNEAIRLFPANFNASFNRGRLYYSMQRYAEAISDLDEVIKLEPTFARAYISRGHAKNASGNPVGMIEDHAKAMELGAKPEDLNEW